MTFLDQQHTECRPAWLKLWFYTLFLLSHNTEPKLDMKLGIFILLNKATPQNWSWHPVWYLEEIRYFLTPISKWGNLQKGKKLQLIIKEEWCIFKGVGVRWRICKSIGVEEKGYRQTFYEQKKKTKQTMQNEIRSKEYRECRVCPNYGSLPFSGCLVFRQERPVLSGFHVKSTWKS